jgi:hypothetical protein
MDYAFYQTLNTQLSLKYQKIPRKIALMSFKIYMLVIMQSLILTVTEQ